MVNELDFLVNLYAFNVKLQNSFMIPGSIKNFMSFRQISLGFLLILIVSASGFSAAGQTVQPEVPPFKDRLFYGGNLNLQFGTYTDIQVSPVIGLWVLPRVGIAIGPDFSMPSISVWSRSSDCWLVNGRSVRFVRRL